MDKKQKPKKIPTVKQVVPVEEIIVRMERVLHTKIDTSQSLPQDVVDAMKRGLKTPPLKLRAKKKT
jgi:hypothetical protein